MAKKNYFLQIFFVSLSIFSLVKLYDNAINRDAWQYGEWLINYEHGFIRRGLVGEIIFLLSNIFENNIKVAFLFFLSSICLLYYYYTYKFIKDIKFNFIHYLIIFSPLFYFFLVIISKVGVKKEILLYIFYIFYLSNIISKKFDLSKLWKFTFLFVLLLLNHESAFFYLPYLIAPLLFIIKKNNLNKFAFQLLILLFVSSLTLIILYLNKGSIEHTNNICESLHIYAPVRCNSWGPIYALSHDLNVNINDESNLFFYLSANMKTSFLFIFYILYSFLPILVFMKFNNLSYKILLIKNLNLLRNIFLFVFIFSFPLFHFAEDWSRWFSIHFHLFSLLIFFLYKKNIVKTKSVYKFNFINSFLIFSRFKNLFFILLFIYATTLHHHHFFFKGVELEFTYYKIYKKIKDSF